MKRIILLALIVLTGGIVFGQNDFRVEFAKLDSLPNRVQLVYNGAVTPLWIDSANFCFETREAEGIVYYKVNITQETKVRCSKEELPEQGTSPRSRRFSGERRDTVPSPDGKWNAFISDNNLWIEEVTDKDQKEKIKLSFDGTANNFYTNVIIGSPDSRKIAAIKSKEAPKRTIPLIKSSP